jgi:hypothetical protein
MIGLSFRKGKQVSSSTNRKLKLSFKIDWFYVLLFGLFVGACASIYLSLNQNLNIDDLEVRKESLSQNVTEIETKILNRKKDLAAFNKKIDEMSQGEEGKKFIPSIEKFGVYKLIMLLDEYEKIFGISYKISDKEKRINSNYGYYDLTLEIPYNGKERFTTMLDYITHGYFMSFEEGVYENEKFVLKYKIYAKKG